MSLAGARPSRVTARYCSSWRIHEMPARRRARHGAGLFSFAALRCCCGCPSGQPLQSGRPRAPRVGRAEMPDLGLTHVALSVRDLDASIAFYEKYAGMAVVHRRAHDGVRSVWLTDRTRPFVIVLVEGEP